MAENGKLIIHVPNLQAPDGQLHRYNDFTHEVGFIEHSLGQVLLAAGFTKFQFFGFEQILRNSIKKNIIYYMRVVLWFWVKVHRRINQNLNPQILNPVFFAVVEK